MDSFITIISGIEKFGTTRVFLFGVFSLILWIAYSKVKNTLESLVTKIDHIDEIYFLIIDKKGDTPIYYELAKNNKILLEENNKLLCELHGKFPENFCDREACPHFSKVEDLTVSTNDMMQSFKEEGKKYREDTKTTIEEISREIRNVTNELFSLIRILVDRLGEGKKGGSKREERIDQFFENKIQDRE